MSAFKVGDEVTIWETWLGSKTKVVYQDQVVHITPKGRLKLSKDDRACWSSDGWAVGKGLYNNRRVYHREG